MAKKKAKSKTEVQDSQSTESFEDSLAHLEQIVRDLESGKLTLSDSLKMYEQGIQHLKKCHQMLETTERRIQLLVGIDRDGNEKTRPFDGNATTLTDFEEELAGHQDDEESELESQVDDHFSDDDQSDEDVEQSKLF